MTNFEVYANGIFWGVWAAETADQAIQMAADEVGTDGDTSGLVAVAA